LILNLEIVFGYNRQKILPKTLVIRSILIINDFNLWFQVQAKTNQTKTKIIKGKRNIPEVMNIS